MKILKNVLDKFVDKEEKEYDEKVLAYFNKKNDLEERLDNLRKEYYKLFYRYENANDLTDGERDLVCQQINLKEKELDIARADLIKLNVYANQFEGEEEPEEHKARRVKKSIKRII